MYCPKCGTTLQINNGGLYCPTGDMYLSPAMEKHLLELVEVTPRKPQMASADMPQRIRRWYCPRCQSTLIADDPNRLGKSCPQCGLMLSDRVVYQLVELHRHKAQDGL